PGPSRQLLHDGAGVGVVHHGVVGEVGGAYAKAVAQVLEARQAINIAHLGVVGRVAAAPIPLLLRVDRHRVQDGQGWASTARGSKVIEQKAGTPFKAYYPGRMLLAVQLFIFGRTKLTHAG